MYTPNKKVTIDHLKRDAYLYIRQSSIKQIRSNQESTKRQYDLKEQAISLGWNMGQIKVIDKDQGKSGEQIILREGFQYLVSQVSLEKAGIIMGLEVSRLARNSSDWHRLLELCSLSRTLILDEDGIYDPNDFNDRLVLGLKGTMSEAELHVIKARLQGGVMNKAKRGELKIPLPIGYIYNDNEEIIKDPDKQIQNSINRIFDCFYRTKSACSVIKTFEKEGWLFPHKILRGINKGDVIWSKIAHCRVLQILHNPCYAGVFAYGRKQIKHLPDGNSTIRVMPRENWLVLIKGKRPEYITWEQYDKNQLQLHENAQALGAERHKGPPREGNALLQGIIICGYCGKAMTIRYHLYKGKPSPDYMCQRDRIQHHQPICQSIVGKHIDKAIGEMIIELISPVTLEISLAVQKELEQRWNESDQLWQQQLERAHYEAELSKRRYIKVDPDNRLVSCTLEAEWNKKLEILNKLYTDYEAYKSQKLFKITKLQQEKLMSLSKDFATIWHAEDTPMQERKRMIRLLIDDVTLKKTDKNIEVHIRFKGGQTKNLYLPLPLNITKLRVTQPEIVKLIDKLSEDYIDSKIVDILNKKGYKPAAKDSFNMNVIQRLRYTYKIKNHYDKLYEKGYLTAQEMAKELKVSTQTVYAWVKRNIVVGELANDKGEYLFKMPSKKSCLVKKQGSPLSKRNIEEVLF